MRLADYNQGRRFGNGSGQAGAFGFSGFGGQQSSGTSNPFGAQTNTSSPFGGNQQSNTFGNTNTGGGLFGQNKPTGGGLFGTNTSSSQPSGGLFGTSNNTNTGFGGFGNHQQEQPKTGFSFGSTTNTGTGFGSGGAAFGASNTSNTGGGLFGNNQTTPFGQQNQQSSAPAFGGFGSNQSNQNQSNTNTGFGFGQNNQQKPGGLFGNTNTSNTGGGLFGNGQNNQQQQPSGGLFGNNNSQQQQSGSSLFGPKPATTGSSLFGNSQPSTTNTNSGGGLFGSTSANQNQQNQGGGLFGSNNQQQQKPGGLFGNAGSTGGGLFGNNNSTQQQPAGGSLFGPTPSTNNQQQQSGGLFGTSNNLNNNTSSSSLFGTSQQQTNALAQPQTLQASILDKNPYGSASIFDGLPPPPQPAPMPIATPINRGATPRKNVIPSTYKINPAQSQSRLVTPRRPMGYGFSYSTYGSPSSVGSNVSTPGGFSSSLLHSSISRGLGKSLSTSNLRRSFDSEGESLLSPGAFSAGSSRFSGAGSMKRLQIDRSLRTDLFGNGGPAALPSPDKADQSKQPGILKKKVSFDTNTVGGNEDQNNQLTNGITSNDAVNSAQPSAQEQGFLRSSRGNNRSAAPKTNGAPNQPEMEQVKGNELAIVHEDASPEPPAVSHDRSIARMPQSDPEPGPYYMRPSRAEIESMSKQQRSKVMNFELGRVNCGRVVFNKPVDLNLVKLDELFGRIAQITHRSITVYPDTENKPPVGQGFNVPSTLYLENSWPRQRDRKTPLYEKSGARYKKHVDRLRMVKDTEFVDYDKDTGIWAFKVPHFTTYSLDYDDDASESELQMSTMSSDPGTPTPISRPLQDGSGSSKLSSLQSSAVSGELPSNASSSPNDTFEFRKKKIFPGAFDDSAAVYGDEDMEDMQQIEEPFLDESLAATPSEDGPDEPSELRHNEITNNDRSIVIRDDEMEMAGSFPLRLGEELESALEDDPSMPRSTITSMVPDAGAFGTPKHLNSSSSGDWAEELQKTISPRKHDRQALRESQAYILQHPRTQKEGLPKLRLSATGAGGELTNNIDLLNSLYPEHQASRGRKGVKRSSKGKGYEV